MRLADVPFEETRPPEPPAPPVAALVRGGPAGAAARRFYGRDVAVGVGRNVLHALFAALPVDATSATGAAIAPLFRHLNRNTLAQRRMEAAIARLSPDLSVDERRALTGAWWENTVRTLAEFAQVDRLVDPGRLSFAGAEHAEAVRRAGRPVIVASVHLASWEASFRMLVREEVAGTADWFGVYMPQPNRFENRIVWRLRQKANAYAFPPGHTAVKRMLQLLKGGAANLAILIDEPAEGDVRFPLFGRPLHPRCNLSIAVSLARRTGALILPGHFLREGPARFRAVWFEPLDVADYPDGAAGLAAIARDLSLRFEPAVIDNLSHWYMLDRLKLWGLSDGAPARTAAAAPEAA